MPSVLYVREHEMSLHLTTVMSTLIFWIRFSLSGFTLQNYCFPLAFKEKYFKPLQTFPFFLNFYPLILASMGRSCLQQLLIRFCKGDFKISIHPAILHALIEMLW